MRDRIVYSTGVGTLCPNCRRPVRECVCPKGVPGAAKPAAVRVGREIKGRAGKGVTTVTGLPLSLPDIEALAAKLKKRCGSGGTVVTEGVAAGDEGTAGSGTSGSSDDGCGCSVVGQPHSAAPLLASLGLALLAFRRKRHSKQ